MSARPAVPRRDWRWLRQVRATDRFECNRSFPAPEVAPRQFEWQAVFTRPGSSTKILGPSISRLLFPAGADLSAPNATRHPDPGCSAGGGPAAGCPKAPLLKDDLIAAIGDFKRSRSAPTSDLSRRIKTARRRVHSRRFTGRLAERRVGDGGGWGLGGGTFFGVGHVEFNQRP